MKLEASLILTGGKLLGIFKNNSPDGRTVEFSDGTRLVFDFDKDEVLMGSANQEAVVANMLKKNRRSLAGFKGTISLHSGFHIKKSRGWVTYKYELWRDGIEVPIKFDPLEGSHLSTDIFRIHWISPEKVGIHCSNKEFADVSKIIASLFVYDNYEWSHQLTQ